MPKLKDMRKKNKSRLKPREISEENLSLKNSQIDRLTMIDIAMDRKFKGRNKRKVSPSFSKLWSGHHGCSCSIFSNC